MKLLASCLMLVIGVFAGYFLRTLHDYSVEEYKPLDNRTALTTASCELPKEQIELIAYQLAPLLLKKMDGTNTTLTDSNKTSISVDDTSNTPKVQAEAITKANEIVDTMLANGSIDPENMSHAIQLLEESGQSQEIYKLHAKIAAAVNRGEISPENSGFFSTR